MKASEIGRKIVKRLSDDRGLMFKVRMCRMDKCFGWIVLKSLLSRKPVLKIFGAEAYRIV